MRHREVKKYGLVAQEYTQVVKPYKVRALVYDDGNGYYEIFKGRTQILCVESGNLDGWIDSAAMKTTQFGLLSDFLYEIKEAVA